MSDHVNPNAVEFDENEEESVSIHYDVNSISLAVVTATDWTTETIIGQLRRENIMLEPRFQRRDAWTKQRKSRFIESVMLGLPIPQVVLAEYRDRRGKYIVLDGKQRLLSLMQFVGDGVGKNNNFALTGMDVLNDMEKKTWFQIRNDFTYAGIVDAFQNHTIRAVVIRNWPDENFLHLVFRRLNTGSVSLSTQELRQALFPGEFTKFLDDRAIDSKPLKRLLNLSEPDFRMRDLELMLRFVAFRNFMPDYNGNMKVFLDSTCGRLNKTWDEKKEDVFLQLDSFDAGILSAIEIFGLDDVARKPKTVSTRRPFNKAIFEVIVFYFSDAKIRAAAEKAPDQVKSMFEALWDDKANEDKENFVRSVEISTKTINAAYYRFSVWGMVLKECLGLSFNVPCLDRLGNRIIFNGLWGN